MFIPLLAPAIIVATSFAQPAAPADADNPALQRLAGIWALDPAATEPLVDLNNEQAAFSYRMGAQVAWNITYEITTTGRCIAVGSGRFQCNIVSATTDPDGAINLQFDQAGLQFLPRIEFLADNQIRTTHPQVPHPLVYRRVARTDPASIEKAKAIAPQLVGKWRFDPDATDADPDIRAWPEDDRQRIQRLSYASQTITPDGMLFDKGDPPGPIVGLGPDGAVFYAVGDDDSAQLFWITPKGPDEIILEQGLRFRLHYIRAVPH